MGDITIGIILVLVIVVFWILFRTFRIVPEYERLVILALGRYAGTRGPGISIVIPLLESAVRVDMRERFLDIPAQTAITLDNAPIDIDFLIYYRVTDPRKAVLEVSDVVSASLNMATTILRAVIGDIELDSVLSQRERINNTLRTKLDEITERWGLKITNVEIREIKPPREVQDAMNRQMTAERERRAVVTRASGEREAAIATAEGDKQSQILRAQGDRESAILRAEGERQSQLLRAQGYAKALEAIYAEARNLDGNTMLLQYLDALRTIGSSPATKFVVPMEVTSMMKDLGGLISGSMTAPGIPNASKAAPASSDPGEALPPELGNS
ncbi:MAG: SPFH/Band 7/PHB domain protein [Chloroflexi bacterium]|nr:SPFH/Band 7/PHB domain protein [Chloroflexota bacterium]